MGYRIETDTMGEVQVEESRYWGAQTQRSLQNFPIGQERFKMPRSIRAPARVRRAALVVTRAA